MNFAESSLSSSVEAVKLAGRVGKKITLQQDRSEGGATKLNVVVSVLTSFVTIVDEARLPARIKASNAIRTGMSSSSRMKFDVSITRARA